MPKLKELSAKHADQGLVLIGVHSMRGGEKMPAFVKDKAIGYPVAWDRKGTLAKAFGVDGYPDYQVIDRSGHVRVADLVNGAVEETVLALLEEPAPAGEASAVPAALAGAAKTATMKDTQVLAVFGSAAENAAVRALTSKDRALGTLLRNEYQTAWLETSEHGALLAAAGVEGGAASLVAYSATGKVLGSRPVAALDGAGLSSFLTKHQLARKDAIDLWNAALAQAKREQKRVLVHLGTPW